MMQRAHAGAAVTRDEGMADRSNACSFAAPRLRDQLVVPQAVVGALEGLAEQVLALQGLPLPPSHRAAQQLPQHPATAPIFSPCSPLVHRGQTIQPRSHLHETYSYLQQSALQPMCA